MIIHCMPPVIHYVFKIVGFSGSKCARTGDEFIPILGSVNSFRRLRFQAKDGILRRKKLCWSSHRKFVLEKI